MQQNSSQAWEIEAKATSSPGQDCDNEEANAAAGGWGHGLTKHCYPSGSPPAHASETEGDLRRACPTLKSQ